MPSSTPHPYAVNLWGSHPHAGNDDCWVGGDIATLEEALAAYHDPTPPHFGKGALLGVTWVQLTGPDLEMLREIADPVAHPPSDESDESDESDWRRERAMELGMGLGIDAYNDAMGWGDGR